MADLPFQGGDSAKRWKAQWCVKGSIPSAFSPTLSAANVFLKDVGSPIIEANPDQAPRFQFTDTFIVISAATPIAKVVIAS
jgi:hypothetical protein